MSKSDSWENDLLLLVFNNTTAAAIGDAAGLLGSAGDGNLYVGLHTANPDEAGDAESSETAYTGYARVAVSRTGTTGWTVTANSVSPTADIDFGECTALPGAAVGWFSVSTGIDGAGPEDVLYYGTLTPPITMATGVIPRIKTTSTITEG